MPYPSLKNLVKRTCEAWFEVVALNYLAEDELRFLQAVLGSTTEEEIIVQLLRGGDSEVLSKVYSLAHSARYLAPRLRKPKTRAYMAAIFLLLSEVDLTQHCSRSAELNITSNINVLKQGKKFLSFLFTLPASNQLENERLTLLSLLFFGFEHESLSLALQAQTIQFKSLLFHFQAPLINVALAPSLLSLLALL
ncbi:hypothetical protein PsorP6_013771 [Peronosclerospora sorghi]|uniref:Uncharacterized protein n=1 Tax=Peronosclerospora sorghi TaxID=230839 RepID=A0ACC0VJM9_9STRA|nr:hypothetical protein PsorP6_013771 [Peronosclerospora sorghi]